MILVCLSGLVASSLFVDSSATGNDELDVSAARVTFFLTVFFLAFLAAVSFLSEVLGSGLESTSLGLLEVEANAEFALRGLRFGEACAVLNESEAAFGASLLEVGNSSRRVEGEGRVGGAEANLAVSLEPILDTSLTIGIMVGFIGFWEGAVAFSCASRCCLRVIAGAMACVSPVWYFEG